MDPCLFSFLILGNGVAPLCFAARCNGEAKRGEAMRGGATALRFPSAAAECPTFPGRRDAAVFCFVLGGLRRRAWTVHGRPAAAHCFLCWPGDMP